MRGALALVAAMVLLVALATGIAGCGSDTTTTTAGEAVTTSVGETATTAASGGGAADGAAVFASICSGCHGADGTGGAGPDLTARTSLTKDRIVDQVTNGGTSMPAYGSQLSTEEIDAVADYVLSDIVQQ